MARPGEKIVREYLESNSLTVQKIAEGQLKTVDFAVYSEAALIFFLEEKTLEINPPAWRSVDPVYNTILKQIHEARKQFKSINPDRLVPNVLSFTNRDPARNINYLFGALTGIVFTTGGKVCRLQQFDGKDINLPPINLYLWFDDAELSGHIWAEVDPDHEASLAAALRLQ